MTETVPAYPAIGVISHNPAAATDAAAMVMDFLRYCEKTAIELVTTMDHDDPSRHIIDRYYVLSPDQVHNMIEHWQGDQSAAAASRDEDMRELVDDLLEVLLTNLTRRMRLEGPTTDTEILAAWQPYEVGIRARLERLLASRDARITAFVDDLLDLLQEVGGMSAEWCETEMRKFETLLRKG